MFEFFYWRTPAKVWSNLKRDLLSFEVEKNSLFWSKKKYINNKIKIGKPVKSVHGPLPRLHLEYDTIV